MPLEKKTIWLLVADSARARLFNVDRRAKAFELIDEWSDDVASGKDQDIQADRQGRTFDSPGPGDAGGQGRHAMEWSKSPKGVAKGKFVAMLAETLETRARRQDFDELHVVAAPRTLGELRENFDTGVNERLAEDEPKDLTQFTQPELEDALGGRFWKKDDPSSRPGVDGPFR